MIEIKKMGREKMGRERMVRESLSSRKACLAGESELHMNPASSTIARIYQMVISLSTS